MLTKTKKHIILCLVHLKGNCFSFLHPTRIVWIFELTNSLPLNPFLCCGEMFHWKSSEVKLSLSLSFTNTLSTLIAPHRPQLNEPISFAGTPVQNKYGTLINTGWLITTAPQEPCLRHLRRTQDCHRDLAVARLRECNGSPTCVMFFQCRAGSLMADPCHDHSHSSIISNAFDGRRKLNLKNKCFRERERERGEHGSLRGWLMGFKQHPIWACDATLRGMGSVVRGPRDALMRHFYGDPSLKSCNPPPCFVPSILPLRCFLSNLVKIVAFSSSPCMCSCASFWYVTEMIPLSTDPHSSGWRDNEHGGGGEHAVVLSFSLFFSCPLSASVVPPSPLSLSLSLSLSLMESCRHGETHSSLPWRARLQRCAVSQKLGSCLGSSLTYFICTHRSPFTTQLRFLFCMHFL